jgi:hypothetical protein
MLIDSDELKHIIAIETATILAGEDLLDIQEGESTLSPETIALITSKRDYAIARRAWAMQVMDLYDDGLDFLERKLFDISPESAAEIASKLSEMDAFAHEFRAIQIGADTLIVTEV